MECRFYISVNINLCLEDKTIKMFGDVSIKSTRNSAMECGSIYVP